MATEKSTIWFPTICVIAISVVILGGFAEVLCPDFVTIEEGDTVIVSCNITEMEIVLVYWYKGDTATTSPILRLENGKPGGIENGRGHYNITSSGAMVITNAKVTHEALYTVLMHFHDGTGESKHINVTITFTPWPSCPLIGDCVPCEECSVVVNDTGKMMCNINGARPMIPLKWIITNQNGVSIVEHPPVLSRDLHSDTWNSSIEISYSVSSCNQEANIQCVALDYFNLLHHSKSLIRIYTANCSDSSPVSPPRTTIKAFIIVSVFIVGILTSVLMIYIYINWRRKRVMIHEGFSLVSSDEPLSTSQKVSEETVQKLVLDLKAKYKVSCLLDPLPWRYPIEVADLYAGYHCEVTHKNGGSSCTSTDNLLTSNEIINEPRVLITNSSGYGVTMFTKQFVQQWIQNNKNDFILLFITKREAKANMKLIDFFEKETTLSHDLIVNVIENRRCILFLDGIANNVFHENKNNTVKGEVCPSESENTYSNSQSLLDMTLPGLFERLEKSAKIDVQIWITSYSEETNGDNFSLPYVKVKINHVYEQQLHDFISKACTKCITLFDQTVAEQTHSRKDVDTTGTQLAAENIDGKQEKSGKEHVNRQRVGQEYELNKKKSDFKTGSETFSPDRNNIKRSNSSKPEDKLRDHVKKFLQKHQIYQELKELPILISVFVYTIVSKCLSQLVSFDDVNALKIEDIICTVIDCLQEAYFAKQVSEDSSIFTESLGKLALHMIDKQIPILNNCDDDLNLAIKMGILQHSKKASDIQQTEEYTNPSLSYCVKFSSQHFKHFCAANYLVQSTIYYNETLAKYETSENFPVLKFMVHLAQWPENNLVDAFRKFKMDDDVIEYLNKWDDQDGVRKVLTELGRKEIYITNLRNLEHRNAFASFCEKCCNLEITLKSVHIIGEVSLSFMTSLGLPILGELTFCDLNVDKGAFLQIIECLSTKDITLRFLECDFTKDLRKILNEQTNIVNGIKVKISTYPDDVQIQLQNCNMDT